MGLRGKHSGGLSPVKAALGVAVAAGLIGPIFYMVKTASDQNRQATAAAEAIDVVVVAAKAYMRDNAAALSLLTDGGRMLAIPAGRARIGDDVPQGAAGLRSIQGAGYLPQDYVDMNTYGQLHVLVVKQGKAKGGADSLEAMVISQGGSTITDTRAVLAAKTLGPKGGYMALQPIRKLEGMITGGGEEWAARATDWTTNGAAPSSGHLMVELTLDTNTVSAPNKTFEPSTQR